ncbi:Sds3p PWA37_003484 [Arxiozyma heterogenica]|uniref:Uncharacterized protein n=1 Tax=Arxiozyma heterogenica TaxID=278026 RepID=A0AAN8A7H9_9SACH|nr:hypothetical protein RI543_001952 [Kazachstania heterogenica]
MSPKSNTTGNTATTTNSSTNPTTTASSSSSNGTATTTATGFSHREVSRKNKRRINLENKVNKISENFIKNKDLHYKDRLTTLQTNLTSLHQGTNLLLLSKLRDLEEIRDLELVRLRLYEEYRVSRSSIEFQEDIEKAKSDHEKLVKLCKEKLYFKIEQKIRKLQEERLLMDVANLHSYSMDYSRPFIYQKNTRSQTVSGANNNINENNGYTNYEWESSSNEFATRGDTANDSATDTGTERRSLRRRTANSRNGNASGTDVDGGVYGNSYYLLGEVTEESDFRSRYSSTGSKRHGTTNNNSTQRGKHGSGNQSDINSDADFLQGISDYEDLQTLLFGEKTIETTTNSNKKRHRINPRYSTKSAPPLESLTPDEVTSDIALIRELTGQSPAPFKLRNPPIE